MLYKKDVCVRFDSTGGLAESENASIIGTYEYVADVAGGSGYYENQKNGLYLYYLGDRGVSIILHVLGCTN